MPRPWNEIRDKAIAFSREWQDAESERAEAQTFWNEFFAVFGVPRRRVASFEEPVGKLGAQCAGNPFDSDAERVAFLFDPYRKYTTLLPSEGKAGKTKRTAKKPKKSAH